MHVCVFVMLLCSLCSQGGATVSTCEKRDACSCLTDDGYIDLTPLGNTDGTAKFPDVISPNGDSFSWNPCKPFSEGTCINVAACQIQGILPPSFYNIGTQDSATFSVDPTKGPQVTYSADTLFQGHNLTTLRETVVTLVCDPGSSPGEVTAEGETTPGSGQYFLTLKSAYACEVLTSGGLSVGSIMLIILLITTLMYISSGISFQKFVRKAEGKDIFPNYSFWATLPGYVKTGCFFTLGLCTRRRHQQTDYGDI